MKRATVIGGRGFVGRGLVAHLRAAGWQVQVPPRDAAFPRRDRSLGHVFYCAGMTADFARRPRDTVEAHAGLLARVLESDAFDALVYLSSTRLYDGLDAAEPAEEGTPIAVSPGHPRHLYDVTKLAGETLCATMAPGRARVARLAKRSGLAWKQEAVSWRSSRTPRCVESSKPTCVQSSKPTAHVTARRCSLACVPNEAPWSR